MAATFRQIVTQLNISGSCVQISNGVKVEGNLKDPTLLRYRWLLMYSLPPWEIRNQSCRNQYLFPILSQKYCCYILHCVHTWPCDRDTSASSHTRCMKARLKHKWPSKVKCPGKVSYLHTYCSKGPCCLTGVSRNCFKQQAANKNKTKAKTNINKNIFMEIRILSKS